MVIVMVTSLASDWRSDTPAHAEAVSAAVKANCRVPAFHKNQPAGKERRGGAEKSIRPVSIRGNLSWMCK